MELFEYLVKVNSTEINEIMEKRKLLTEDNFPNLYKLKHYKQNKSDVNYSQVNFNNLLKFKYYINVD